MLSFFNTPAFFVFIAGTLVGTLCLFIIGQGIVQRLKNNRVANERLLVAERFDALLMLTRIEVQEETFSNVGKELHDNIGQLMSNAQMLLRLLEDKFTPPPDLLTGAIESLEKAIYEMRSMSKLLDHNWLENFDLYRSLALAGEQINASGKLRIEVFRNSHLMPLTAERQCMLFRLMQEGIQNVIKHAEAVLLNISIYYKNDRLIIKLEDDGKGFDSAVVKDGMGKRNMRERALALGADIFWESSASGTVVIIDMPIEKNIL